MDECSDVTANDLTISPTVLARAAASDLATTQLGVSWLLHRGEEAVEVEVQALDLRWAAQYHHGW